MKSRFFMCACAIDDVIRDDAKAVFERWRRSDKAQAPVPPPTTAMRPLNVMIVDDPEHDNDRGRIRSSFRELRGMVIQVMRPADQPGSYTWSNRLQSHLDDVFFGSSAKFDRTSSGRCMQPGDVEAPNR
jgi:hypothetical protein